LDYFGDSISELIELVKYPSVLIGKLTFVFWIWVFWSVIWSGSTLEEHLGVGFEKMWKEFLFNLIDLLERFDTIIKNGQD
tara:strand:+ start:3724 stop:3963 length:240 start_codon:yes stop_codon:yes gene_type:complete